MPTREFKFVTTVPRDAGKVLRMALWKDMFVFHCENGVWIWLDPVWAKL